MERKEIFNKLSEIFIDVLDLDEVELTDETFEMPADFSCQ